MGFLAGNIYKRFNYEIRSDTLSLSISSLLLFVMHIYHSELCLYSSNLHEAKCSLQFMHNSEVGQLRLVL
jgi:hypothetical protein